MRIKHSNKRIVFETALTILCGCFVVFACLVDFIDIPFLAMLKIRVSDVEAMHMNLFTIQATISVTGAAIISLLTGVTSKEFYGVTVSKFITRIYPVFLKHHLVIIFTFAITLADYFAVSLRLFDVSLAIFSCSVLALIYLVRDTFVVFMGDNEIKNRIAESIKESDLTGYAQALFLQSKLYAQTGLFIELKDNLTLVESILEREAKHFKISSDNTKIEMIEGFLIDIFKIIVKRKQPDENSYFLIYLLKTYQIMNKSQIYFDLWWKSPYLFFQSIRYITYDEYREHLLFSCFFENLIKNEKYDLSLRQESADIFINSLIYYSNSIYKYLFASDKQSLLIANKNKIIIDLYEDVSLLKNYDHAADKLISSEYEWLLIQLDLCYLLKCFIDNGESGEVWNRFFSEYQILNRSSEIDFSMVCITNYMFYLAEYESLAKDKPAQLQSRELLNTYNHVILDYFYSCNFLEILKKYKAFIFEIVDRWEWLLENEAKFVVSEHSTTDFIIFISLNTCWNDNDLEEIIEILSDGSMFSLYNRYFSEADSFEKLYLSFHCLFFGTENTTNEKERLLEILNKKYKQEILDKGEQNEIKDQEIENYKKTLLGYCIEAKEEYKNLFHSVGKIETKKDNIQTIPLASFSVITPISEDYSNQVIRKGIKQMLPKAYLSLVGNNLQKRTVVKDNKAIQQTVIDYVNESCNNLNVVLGSRFIFWLEENRTLLKDYLSQNSIESISVPGLQNEYFFIDTSLTDISICDFTIKIREYTQEEIIKSCETDDNGDLLYNVTNDIVIPFEQTDLFDYFRRTARIVEICVDLCNKTNHSNIGLQVTIEEA